jgi:Fe2+ or Zn2+ uptake regulation protein
VTPQRVAVLEAVEDSGEHLSAEQVYEKVRRTMPHISLATVYKALNELRELGKVEILPVSGKLRYDAAGEPDHHHLVCEACKLIVDVPAGEQKLGIGENAPAAMGFEILRTQITYRGICPDCQGSALVVGDSGNPATATIVKEV